MDIFMIICHIALFMCIPILVFCFLMLKRNEKVADFRRKVIDLCDKRARRGSMSIEEAYKPYHALPPYSKMLYSFKPLTFKSYYNRREMSELGIIATAN